MNTKIFAAIGSVSLMALAACSSDEPDVAVDTDTMAADTATNDMAMANDAYPTAGTLNTEQQSRYDAMDRQAVSDEYDTNQDAMTSQMAGSSQSGAMASPTSTPTSTNTSSSMSGSSTGSNSAMASMPSRGEMDFAFLDRNDDGKLSVAEYAIWAVPVNPNREKANDQTKPYLTQDQINEAGQTFFAFDDDGDTYLQQAEFQSARNSARTPG